ncbi:MAG: hypothetical protein NC200_04920 [Candidatus Gastranaerophilales bacterium]|nr:hypothetical protein [Candidatus Gastranaerophilales bacterium]
MNVLSRYTFISTYQSEKLTKQEATEVGIGSVDFSKCDTDGDGNITIEEILANTEVCAKILASINAEAKAAGKAPVEQEETAKENQFALDA